MTIFHVFSATIIISVSCLAMLVIYKNKKLHNIQGIFRFNLAFSDFLCSFVFIGSAVAPYYNVFSPTKFKNVDFKDQKLARNFFNETKNDNDFEVFFLNSLRMYPISKFKVTVFGFVCYSAGFSSMYSYLVASIDRFIAIRYPFKYKRKASKSKAYKACFLVWFFAITFTLIPVLNKSFYFWFFKSMFVFYTGKYEILIDLVYFVPLIFCWILNILTLISIKKSKKKMLKLVSAIAFTTRNLTRTTRLETRVSAAAKTLFIMVLTFTISFLPFNVMIFMYNTSYERYIIYNGAQIENKNDHDTSFDYIYILCVILLYNNFWNFFIYQVRDSEFRNYSKSTLCAIRSKKKVSKKSLK